jgi:SagB-type dehydrogenase family enzyme
MKALLSFIVVLTVFSSFNIISLNAAGGVKMSEKKEKIALPNPRYESTISVEEAILKRRSVRNYVDRALKLEEISQLLWAAQGITDEERKFRAAPSAGALYGLELFLVVGNVSSLKDGIYRYEPFNHALIKHKEGDYVNKLSLAALGQSCVKDGAVDIVIAGVYDRVTRKYGDRGIRYTHMEAGHAAQNIYLQAEALELGTVVVGAFMDEKVKEVIDMKEEETPLYIMPVGKK